MYSDEEDAEVKIYWGDMCNEYLLEDWMEAGKKLYNYRVDDYKPAVAEMTDKPWMLPGAEISDWFNFGFNEETWNEFLLNQIKMRQEMVMKKEQEARLAKRAREGSPKRRNHDKKKSKKYEGVKKRR